MPKKKAEAMIRTGNLEKRASPDFKSIYANHAELGFSKWDMWIDFCEVVVGHNDDHIDIKARIVTSLPHAKKLCQILNENMAKFEQRFGEIPIFDTEGTQETSRPAPKKGKGK